MRTPERKLFWKTHYWEEYSQQGTEIMSTIRTLYRVAHTINGLFKRVEAMEVISFHKADGHIERQSDPTHSEWQKIGG